MRINWKLRIKNKATLTTLVLALVALVYQILGIFGIVAPISEDKAVEVCGAIINIMALLGIVIDPTTSGVDDSIRAMTYEEPRDDRSIRYE